MSGGYVKLWRSIEDWEWYHDLPVRVLFQHLLLKVNWEPKRWQGMTVEPGQLVTSLDSLSAGSGLSVKQVRTALDKLKSTGEVGDQSANKFRVVSLRKWAEYQSDDEKGAGKWQANGKQAANKGQAEGDQRATTKEGEEEKNLKKGKKLSPNGERGARTPEQIEEVRNAFKAACKVVTDADPTRLVPKERNAFFAYWTEPDKKGQLRFEDEKFFDHGRRMDTWMANANSRKDGGPFNGNGSTAYGKAEAEAEMAAIRAKNGRDPQWGPVYDGEMSPDLIAYNKALLRTTK